MQIGSSTIPADELAWQLDQQFKQIARDVEKTLITGVYANPGNNSTPRKTRGLLAACTTNTVASPASPTAVILDLMQKAWENGGLPEGETRTAIAQVAKPAARRAR